MLSPNGVIDNARNIRALVCQCIGPLVLFINTNAGLVAWLRLRIEQQRNLEALPARALLPLVGCAAAPQVIERPEEVRVPVAVPCAHRPAYLPHLVRGVA